MSETSYNEIPYRAIPISQAHPERLSVMATLVGLPHPVLANCRVLEIGCAEGTNLMSMAQGMPAAEFVGIDLSPRQIEDGNKILKKVGIKNVTLQALDLMDVNESFGRFDFILAHGVFSWVPDAVRDRMLEICRDHLTDAGLAFLSYNTLPGWYMVRGLRELMCYHTKNIQVPAEKMQQARKLLREIIARFAKSTESYEFHLHKAAERIVDRREGYVYHEYLEAENAPFYFSQFVDKIAEYGLAYVGDTEIDEMDRSDSLGELEKLLNSTANDWIELQQQRDMVDGTMFRRSVICKSGEAQRPIDPSRVESLLIASSAQNQGTNEKGETKFVAHNGKSVETKSGFVITVFQTLLEEWPARITFQDLFERVMAQLDEDPEEIRTALAQIIFRCTPSQLIQLNAFQPCLGSAQDERPRINPLAILDLEDNRDQLTSLFHCVVKANEICTVLYPLLDGTRTKEEVLAEMAQQALDGKLNVEKDGAAVTDLQELTQLLKPALDSELNRAEIVGLLMAESS